MDFFEATLISSILTVFPILLYFIYLIYNYDFDKVSNELILDLCLVTSFYLAYKIESGNISYFLIFIPLLISYVKKRSISVLVIFALTVSCGNLYLIIAEIIIYIVSLIIKNKKVFVFVFLIINFITASSILKDIYDLDKILLFKIAIESLFGVLLTVFILNLFNQMNKVINVYMNLNEVKKDAKIQESLFKITHEIKNPIAVCKGYLDMYNVDSLEHSHKYIPIIKSEIARTLIILQDFLCLRKVELFKEELDLTLLFDETIEEMSLYKNVKFVKKYDDEIYINGDYNRLKQVLINVFKNSIESNCDTITTEILVKKDIVIKISDNGSGMNEETLKRIREPFYTTKTSGTGLGVPLLIEIIEAHGWFIKYDSVLAEGTMVLIRIPRKK